MEITAKIELVLESEEGLRIPNRVIEVLMAIEECGSLNGAVKELGVSYSYTWNILYKINCHMGTPLVHIERGGKGGGSAMLTPAGKQFLLHCNNLMKENRISLETSRFTI